MAPVVTGDRVAAVIRGNANRRDFGIAVYGQRRGIGAGRGRRRRCGRVGDSPVSVACGVGGPNGYRAAARSRGRAADYPCGCVKGDASGQDALDGIGGLGSAVGLWHGDCRDGRSHFPRLGIAGIVGE